jgi:hypothetical protein
MGDQAWIGFFAVNVVLLGLSVSIILKPFEDMAFFQNYTAYILLVDGIVEIVNIFYLNYRTKTYRQGARKGQNEEETLEEVFEPRKEGMEGSVEPAGQEGTKEGRDGGGM